MWEPGAPDVTNRGSIICAESFTEVNFAGVSGFFVAQVNFGHLRHCFSVLKVCTCGRLCLLCLALYCFFGKVLWLF